MRIVFMGTPEFSAKILSALYDGGHEIAAVVTQPDRPAGRGKKILVSPVKELVSAYGTPVLQPARLRGSDEIGEIKEMLPDVIVVAAFGQILPGEVLKIPRYGCINIHASLLPKYRGAAPIERAIADGERVTGVTAMFMDEGLDTGDIAESISVDITDDDTGASLTDKLSDSGARLIIKTLGDLEKGTIKRQKQNDSLSTYAHMLKKEEGRIDFSMSAAEIERRIRAFDPWPGSYTRLSGRILKVWRAGVESEPQAFAAPTDVKSGPQVSASATDAKGESQDSGIRPGTVIGTGKSGIRVATGDGVLVVRELQPEGKKRMPADAFLRGHDLKEGTCFSDE